MLLLDTAGIAPERDPAIAGAWYGDRLTYQNTALTTIAQNGDPAGFPWQEWRAALAPGIDERVTALEARVTRLEGGA